MRLSVASTALVLALTTSISAAPAATLETSLTKRQVEAASLAIADLQDLKKKRDTYTPAELAKRESAIVTKILEYIKDTDLSAKIIEYLVTNSYFEPIVTKTIIKLIKNGTININTLFKALNDSGLAVSVIKDLINDCELYAEIYKLAAEEIGNLADKIKDALSGKSSSSSSASKRDISYHNVEKRDEESILVSLMESLKDSGLANQVVEELVTNKDFLKYGASLIEKLFSSGALTLGQVVDAIAQSGLVPSLFKAFLNFDTLKTVIVNALAAAFGKCGGSTATTGTATATASASISTSTSTGGSGTSCKRKRQYV